jgi:hypothetical protein
MAFKMKGMNFGKGTGFDLPNKVNSGFKKSSRLGRFVKAAKEVGSAIKETITTGKTPSENQRTYRMREDAKRLINQKIRQGRFDESKLNSFEKDVYKGMKAKKAKANMEKNVAENKAAGPKTQTQKKDEKRPPMAMKNKEAMKMVKDPIKMVKDPKKDPMKMVKDPKKDPMKMVKDPKKDPMKMKHKDPMKLNKGFDRLPKEVQAKILKNKKKK